MRCGRTQKLIVLAADGEITPADRRRLDEHLAACQACRHEAAAVQSLFAALDELPMEREVPAAVEAVTLRRVRIEAAEEGERGRRWWAWLPAPVLAAAGVGVLAVAIGSRPGTAPEPVASAPGTDTAPAVARAPVPAPPAAPADSPARAETRRLADAGPAAERSPKDPPPELAAAPDLFMNLPIIRNMDKLEHFEAISMIELPPNG